MIHSFCQLIIQNEKCHIQVEQLEVHTKED